MNQEYISRLQIKRQKWKFYFLAAAWPAYLFMLPGIYGISAPASLLFMIFPGIFLYTWVACLMHECWHKYVPTIPNGFFYNLFSYYSFSDPQIYRLVHGWHHSKVNTWDDTEFHPLGRITGRFRRRACNFCEIILGVIFTFGLLTYVVPRHDRYAKAYRQNANLLAILICAVVYGGLGALSAAVFDLHAWHVAAPLLISFWLNSFFIHHTQLIEHGGLIVDGDIYQRNLATRNLRNKSIAERLFLFLTHHDSQTHVLHHTAVALYSRPFTGKVPLPDTSVIISMRQYLDILWRMVKEG